MVFERISNKTKQKFNEDSDVYKIGIDSLDLIEMITEAEDDLGVQISDEDLESIKKVKDIIAAFKKVIK